MLNIKRFHPGVFLKENLEFLNMNAKEFSLRTGISERTLSDILNEKSGITLDVARKLASFFNSSIEAWMNMQNSYEEYIKEQDIRNSFIEDYNLIKGSKKYMHDYFNIANSNSHDEYVMQVRKLVGVNKLSALNTSLSFVSLKEQKDNKSHNLFAQNLWIALALTECRKLEIKPYNKTKLLDSIPKLRALTRKEPEVFIPLLKNILYEAGVSFIYIPYLSGSNIYGVTKWLSNDKVMIAISNKGEKADVFWFTLFHEINHVLKAHKRNALISYEDKEDKEADIESADILIPRKKWEEFITKYKYIDIDVIKDFANEIGISPCIVLGRLNKEYPLLFPDGKFDKELSISYHNIASLFMLDREKQKENLIYK